MENPENKSDKTVSFYTLGCRVNSYETSAVEKEFISLGYKVVPFGEECDFCVINTCAVTAESERKSSQIIRRAGKFAKHILAVGCHSQYHPERVMKSPRVEFCGGVAGKFLCTKAAECIEKGEKFDFEIKEAEKVYTEYHSLNNIHPNDGRTRAFIKIQDGCPYSCAYCIIPKLRGPSRSRKSENIISEAKALIQKGMKEIILTGIETGAYSEMPLYDLMNLVSGLKGLYRLRVGSLHPHCITEKFVNAIKDTAEVMPHFHISLQSGSNSVLKGMRRPYNIETAQRAIDLLRENIKDVMLSVDIISGFPGEGELEFEETREFIKKNRFLHVHAFPYSEREGTEAAKAKNKIPHAKAKERNDIITALSAQIEKELAAEQIGKNYSVLVEKIEEGYALGHTENFFECKFSAGDVKPGDIVPVVIRFAEDEKLVGEKI